ncbi:MAG: hypothetical protein ACJA2P_002102 [Rhodoferax sp.]|jgi:membrane protein implicated in regulation of membrane protease activity
MAESTIWWVLAGTLIAVELMTGTFYLLMLAMGLVGGAVAAHFGTTAPVQLAVAAFVGGGFVVFWRLHKLRKSAGRPEHINHGANLDIGATVQVEAWGPDGSSSVRYRGSSWTASLRPGAMASPGTFRIVDVVGSRLIVEKV